MRASRAVLYGLWTVAFALGLVGVWQRIAHGHTLTGYGSYVGWGLWVAAYAYFIGLSAGAFLLSSLVYVFGVRGLERVGPLALVTAVVTLLMALVTIWFDLGHMSRFYAVFTRPNFHSMMTWMIWLYTAYFVLLLAETYLALRPGLYAWRGRPGAAGWVARMLSGREPPSREDLERDRRRLRVLGTIGVPLAIAFHGGVGALFATLSSRPYWHQPLYPILFVVGALVSGAALLSALAAVVWPDRSDTLRVLGRALLGLIALDLLLEWAEFSIPLWYGVSPEKEVLMQVLTGRFWWVFWVVHVLLGSAVPVALLLWRPADARSVGIAGALTALTFLAVRLNAVIPGQVTPELKGLENAFTDHRLTFSYVPTTHEWLVLLFPVALGIGALWLGFRYLPLMETREVEAHERYS